MYVFKREIFHISEKIKFFHYVQNLKTLTGVMPEIKLWQIVVESKLY